jgi:hypothetical protein
VGLRRVWGGEGIMSVVDALMGKMAHPLRPPRGGRSPEERLEALEQKISRLEEQDIIKGDALRVLTKLRARDHLARVAAFTGGFGAVDGAFNNEVEGHKLCYDVRIMGVDVPRLSCTVRFRKTMLGSLLDYDGEILDYDGILLDTPEIESTDTRYEIKHVARRYMLEATDWQEPADRAPAPYSLF